MARGFRDRHNYGVNPLTTTKPSLFGGGGAILPIWGDKLQLQGNVLYGQGVGRYDAAQLFDCTVNPMERGPADRVLRHGRITSHNAIKDLDLYVYAGENHIFNHLEAGLGFGNPANLNNSGCDILSSVVFRHRDGLNNGIAGHQPTLPGTLSQGQIQDVWQVTGGFWQSLYDGDKGKVVWGLQESVYEGHDPRGQEWDQGIRRHERGNVVVPLLSQIWDSHRIPAVTCSTPCHATPFKTRFRGVGSEPAPRHAM